MANYGSHPKDIVKYLENIPPETVSSEILLHLAWAYKLVLDLEEEQKHSTYLQDRPLILDAIEKAWREALYVRASLPTNLLEAPKDCPVDISKMGVISENENTKYSNRAGNSLEGNGGRETDKGISKNKRGARRYKRRISRGSN